MRLFEICALALKNSIRSAKQSVLCATAVAIGVASVLIISAAGRGAVNTADYKLSKLGIDGLTLYVSESDDTQLDPDDAEYIESLQGIERTLPFSNSLGYSTIRNVAGTSAIFGVGEGLTETLQVDLLHGREINSDDISGCGYVAMVDDSYAREAYSRENIVGKSIYIELDGVTAKFEIIGVISSQTEGIYSLIGNEIAHFVYIPYTVVNEFTGETGVDQIAIRCMADADVDSVSSEVEDTMSRTRSRDGTYKVENITAYLSQVKSIVRIIALVVAVAGGISLAVSGLGVANTMLAGLRARRKEMGIYMALGAFSRDIVLCVLFETLFLSLVGGICGLAGGYALLYFAKDYGLTGMPTLSDIAIAQGVSSACALLAGIIPALKAARLEPIEAIRDD